jgi:hypothetical protein
MKKFAFYYITNENNIQLCSYKLWVSSKNDDSVKIRLRTENLIYVNQWKPKLFIEKT